MRVLIQKAGNFLAIHPLTPSLKRALEDALTYKRRTFLQGYDAMVARRQGQPTVQITPTACFAYDNLNRFTCPVGYLKLVRGVLKERGFKVSIKDIKPHPRPEIFEPNFDQIFRQFTLRHKQQEVLLKIATHERARFTCPTGYGKSFLIGCASLMWPKAMIHVLIPGMDLLRQTVSGLRQLVPDVGMIGGGKNQSDRSLLCISADSIHKAPRNADVVFADEVHQFGTEIRLAALAAAYSKPVRAYGFSATNDKRPDGADFEVQGFFGPIRMEIEYEEAMKNNTVVPIEVLWVRPQNVPSKLKSPWFRGLRDTPLNRHGIWENEHRNKLIASVARSFDATQQMLIVVRTVGHAVNLKRLLPEYEMVFDGRSIDPARWEKWIEDGDIPAGSELMSQDQRDQMRIDFEAGRLKKVIATSVWDTGVDFRRLQFLFRADGGSGSILNTQLPGRVSRIFSSESGDKEKGYVIDIDDGAYHRTLGGRAVNRRSDYKAHGWKQRPWSRPKKASI